MPHFSFTVMTQYCYVFCQWMFSGSRLQQVGEDLQASAAACLIDIKGESIEELILTSILWVKKVACPSKTTSFGKLRVQKLEMAIRFRSMWSLASLSPTQTGHWNTWRSLIDSLTWEEMDWCLSWESHLNFYQKLVCIGLRKLWPTLLHSILPSWVWPRLTSDSKNLSSSALNTLKFCCSNFNDSICQRFLFEMTSNHTSLS